MNLYPFNQCVAKAQQYIRDGARVFQQFNCAFCGAKQTMDVPNTFYKLGRCEQCGQETNIERDGMNYMLHWGKSP